MTAPLSKMHRAALAYARLGIRVIPLGNGGTERGKVPRIGEWQTLGSIAAEVIDKWWAEWPEANVGGLTGQGLAVADVDAGHGGLITLEDLEKAHGALPLTPTVKTGSGGLHFWFALSDGVVLPNSAGKLGPGFDFRGSGGQAVLPCSIHPNGTPYSWLGEARIGEVPFAPMPEWMLSNLLGPVTTSTGSAKAKTLGEWDALAGEEAIEGTRNHTLARVAGHLLRRDVAAPLVYSIIVAWNKTHCSPPLGDHEVEAVCDSIAVMERKRRGVAP